MGWLLTAFKCTFSFVASFLSFEIGESLASCRSRWSVALHYWDQTSDLNLVGVFPPILTEEWVTIDEKEQ